MKRDSLSTRSERPQGPLTDIERSEFYLREGERLALMGCWSLRADGIFDYWSPETFVAFGFDPKEGIPNLTQCSIRDLALHEQRAFPFPPLLTGVCPQRNSRMAVLDCPQGQLRMGTLGPLS